MCLMPENLPVPGPVGANIIWQGRKRHGLSCPGFSDQALSVIQLLPLPGLEIQQLPLVHRDPYQAQGGVAQGGSHAPYLAVAAFLNAELYP